MDVEEAARIVYSKIQTLDPENASKIMSYLYIQEGKEKELIRLAFSSEPVLLSVINQAKINCGLLSNTSSTPSTPSSPSPFNPLSNPNRLNPLSQSSPRIVIPNNGFHTNPSSPSSPWSVSGFHDPRSPNFRMSPRPAYATVVNGNVNGSSGSGSFSPPIGSSFSLPSYYSHSKVNDCNTQVRGQLPFLDDSSLKKVDFGNPIMSPGGRSDSFLHPCGDSSGNWDSGNCGDTHHHHLHKRSCSVSDAFLGGDGEYEDAGGGGFGWRPCMYYARGFCKNGNSCKFLHGDFSDCPSDSSASSFVGSPGKYDGFEDEVLRIKMLQQQQQQQRLAFAAQLMAGGSFPSNKGMSFLSDSPRSEAASLMMGDEFHKFNRFRESSDFLAMFNGSSSSTSRQIYLTFPADSTFKEEDVSNYFSKFGPVQDVRIPYQQKRMFGFVTFLYPETVKMILAKGNPHFVCDSRVLVKPYKEKGKIPDKKQQFNHFERGDFPSCLSPSGFDSREPYELPVGPRMLYNNQQMMLRRKLEEQAELQQAIEMQGRRMMNLQLMDLKDGRHGHQFLPNMMHGRPMCVPSPAHSHFNMGEGFVFQNEGSNQENTEENDNNAPGVESPSAGDATKQKEVIETSNNKNGFIMKSGSDQVPNNDDKYVNESFEHALPDNLFASPTKPANHHLSASTSAEADSITAITSSTNTAAQPAAASLDTSSGESCYFQTAR